MFDPQQLTGTLVLEIRTRHNLSRTRFSELAGFTGKSTARLSNIERRESWKSGDREAVARVLDQLEPHFDPRYHPTPPVEPVAVDGEPPPVVVAFPDDDGEDALVDVLPSATTSASTSAPTVAIPRIQETVFEVAALSPTAWGLLADHYPVSNSELQTWKRCRRKWWLAWYRRLALRTEALVGVRAVGDRVHRALQAWYVPEGEPRVDPRDALERVIVEDWTRVAAAARERQLDDDKLAALAVEFGQSTNLERAMIEGYVRWLEETGADAELRVIASETPMFVNVQLDVDGETRRVQLIGKLDVRTYRITDGMRLLMDHKTVADLRAPAATLPQNEQVLHYLLLEYLSAIEEEVRSRYPDESIPGTTYVFRAQPGSSVAVSLLPTADHEDGQESLGSPSPGRESVQQRPEQPRTIMLGMPQFTSQQGRQQAQVGGSPTSSQRGGEASRTATVDGGIEGEDVRVDEGSLAAASERVANGALYNMLRRVKRTQRAQPPFYDRVEVRHNVHELESYKRRLLATTRDVLRAIDALDRGEHHLDVVYPSPRDQCRWDCDFQAVCNLFDDGSRGTEDMVSALYHEVDPRSRYDVRRDET